MSVSLHPSTALGFNRPLTQTVKRTLTLSNHNAQPVAFKVKTTAPKMYCVRPNSGRIEPNESIEVQVMLQAMKEEPPLSAKCKDKFLIQSTVITADKETMALNDIWGATDEKGEESKVHQQKIKVVYLPPEGQALDEEDESTTQNMDSMMSTDSHYATVRQTVAAPNGHTIGGTSIPDFAHESAEEGHHAIAQRAQTPVEEPIKVPSPPSPRIQVTPAVPPSPIKPVIMTPEPEPAPTNKSSNDDAFADLLAKYNETQIELNRMRALLAAMPASTAEPSTTSAPTELRRRTRALSDAMTSTTMAGTYSGAPSDYGSQTDVETTISTSDGVPLQVVVMIAVGIFVCTYVFF